MSEQMTINKVVPKLRFSEFEGSWEKMKLDKLLEFKNGINASKEDYGFGYKFINVLDIIENDFITHDKIIGAVNISKEVFNKNIVQYGDILFQRSSETREEVGQSNVYLDKIKDATFGGFVIRGRKIGNYDPYFFHLLLKSSSARKEITTKSGGSTRYNVGQGILSAIKLCFPAIPEQQKIATFLTAVDSKIQALTKKQNLLEQYKKGVMQKIFSQELRFKDDNGNDFEDWEEKKIKEVFKVTRGSVLAVSKMNSFKTNIFSYPVYSSQTKNNGLTGYYNEYLYENAITWTTDGANAGEVKYRAGKFYCTNVCGVLISEAGDSNNCISEMINKISRKFVSYVGNPKLMNNVMAEIKINFPCKAEQTKIANFLSSIDDKINQVNAQLEKAKQFKKGLLQQLFV